MHLCKEARLRLYTPPNMSVTSCWSQLFKGDEPFWMRDTGTRVSAVKTVMQSVREQCKAWREEIVGRGLFFLLMLWVLFGWWIVAIFYTLSSAKLFLSIHTSSQNIAPPPCTDLQESRSRGHGLASVIWMIRVLPHPVIMAGRNPASPRYLTRYLPFIPYRYYDGGKKWSFITSIRHPAHLSHFRAGGPSPHRRNEWFPGNPFSQKRGPRVSFREMTETEWNMAGTVTITITATITATIAIIITIIITITIVQHELPQVHMHTSKIGGNRAADSVRKTGLEICSPQDQLYAILEEEVAKIISTIARKCREILSWCDADRV